MRVTEPQKLGLPLLLPCAAAMWASSASLYAALETYEAEASFVVMVTCAIALVPLAAISAMRKSRAALVVAFVLLGIALGAQASHSYSLACAALPEGDVRMELTLSSDERITAYGSSCNAECKVEGLAPFSVIAYFDSFNGLLSGQRTECEGRIRRIAEGRTTSSYLNGTVAQVDVLSFTELEAMFPMGAVQIARANAIATIGEHGGDQAGLLQALVCGYRTTMQSDGEYEMFKACGMAHMVAVSGAHLAIVTAMFAFLLRMLRAPRAAVGSASILFVLAYLVFAGIPISAIRAAVMVMLSVVAGAFRRRNATLNSLSVCVIAFLAFSPSACVSVSLFLSAASTLGIILFAPLVESWMGNLPSRLEKLVAEPVGLTLSSNIMTLPYSAAVFGMVPILALPVNVIATPLFSLACVAGLACTIASLAIPPIASLSMTAASALAWPLGALAEHVSALPFSYIETELPVAPAIVVTFLIATLLWATWPKVSARAFSASLVGCLCAYMAFAFLTPGRAEDEIAMLDVGQGDAFLVRSNGIAVLVDTGNEDKKLRDELASLGVRRLDAVIVTHPDDDHCASLSSISQSVEISSFACSSAMLSCGCSKCANLVSEGRAITGNDPLGLMPGDAIEVGRFSLKSIWPYRFNEAGGNADSLCLMAELDVDGDGIVDWKALFTGDAESEQLDEMARMGSLCDVDILKVGHHGSKVSLSDRALDALKPEIALISCGEGNRYGHPTAEAIGMLEGHGAQVMRTDESGTVEVVFSKDEASIEAKSK